MMEALVMVIPIWKPMVQCHNHSGAKVQVLGSGSGGTITSHPLWPTLISHPATLSSINSPFFQLHLANCFTGPPQIQSLEFPNSVSLENNIYQRFKHFLLLCVNDWGWEEWICGLLCIWRVPVYKKSCIKCQEGGRDENHSTFLQEPRLHYIKTILHCNVM